jgi:hypothetical protein
VTFLMIGLVALGLMLLFAPLIGDWLARRDTPSLPQPGQETLDEWFWPEWERDNDE